jgi:hypothetical protein
MAAADPSITTQERVTHVCLAVLLLAYGGCGLYYDDIYIPAKHSRGFHVHGVAAWIMYCAFICGSLNLLSVLADHCDDGSSGRRYHLFARTTQVAGWVFFAASIGYGLVAPRPHW